MVEQPLCKANQALPCSTPLFAPRGEKPFVVSHLHPTLPYYLPQTGHFLDTSNLAGSRSGEIKRGGENAKKAFRSQDRKI